MGSFLDRRSEYSLVKGLSFEYLVDEIFLKNFKIKLYPGSGDSDIDRFFYFKNKKLSIQIKTPVIGLIKKDKSVSFALHKTHGLEKYFMKIEEWLKEKPKNDQN